jgi:hypothetical protein
MRPIIALVMLLAWSGSAHASKSVSGVVAVSTGPMQAYTSSTGRNLAIGRDLVAGDEVFMNDEVETGAKTRAQVLLRDESVFSLAPASKIVFDEFVYDPIVGEGRLQAKLMQGGLRFVSGQLSKRQPQNIQITAGEATVGIRGTEILATHGTQGTTFVLLSGEMEIATQTGNQIINRPGFGIDITSDGLLGAVRQIPLAEINAILAPPPEKQEDTSAGSETSEEGEGDAASEEDEGGENDTQDQDTAADETAPTGGEAQNEEESSFDAALTASVGSSDDESAPTLSGLGDLTAQSAEGAADPSASLSVAGAADGEKGVEIAVADTIVGSLIEGLAEDDQQVQAENENISLHFATTSTLTTNPFFSSNANLLVRSSSYFQEDAPSQYNVTHALLREKFPDSFNDNGFVNHTSRQSSDIDLSSYDAILVRLGSNDNDHNFTPAEVAAYRNFIHSDGKKILSIGRQEPDMGTINSAMPIYHNNVDGYQYIGRNTASSMPQDLSPVESSGSALLLGVTSFGQYNDSSFFASVDFTRDLVADSSDAAISVDNGLLINSYNDYPALDFGDKGAVFFARWGCGANGSTNGYLGASIDSNFVDNGREQFCRNLISSLAPEASLVDVEVGSLSVSGAADAASYRIISGGNGNFKIMGDKLLLDKGASLTNEAGTYALVIGVTPTGAEEVERSVSVAVAQGGAEKRVIATRDSFQVGDTVSFPTQNLISHKEYLEDISWVSIDAASGGGQATNTGVITLHYRITENGATYDRFHEIELVHDCTSDPACDAFATSMDTENELVFNEHFEFDNRSSWESFFDRFQVGTLRLEKAFALSSSDAYDETGSEAYLEVLNASYSHELTVNFGTEAGQLNTAGTFDGIEAGGFDVTWDFNFTDTNGPCEASGSCYLSVSDATGTNETNLRTVDMGNDNIPGVGLMNMALPNGMHSILVRSNLASETADGCNSVNKCRIHETEYQPMTPK